MSADGPWIKFYPADWLTGTRGLSAAEIGIYITLIAMMYEKGAPVVLDTPRLSRSCGIPAASFTKILTTLIDTKKITFEGGGLFHDRVRSELQTREVSRVTASNNAKARWVKDQGKQQSNDAGAEPNVSIARPRQISDIRSQKESTQTDLIDRTSDSLGSAKPHRGKRLPSGWVLPKGWGEWALSEYPHLVADDVRRLADDFRDYWISIPGQKGTKLDWEATWRNSVRMKAPKAAPRAGPAKAPSAFERHTQKLKEKIENDYGFGREAGGDFANADLLRIGSEPSKR